MCLVEHFCATWREKKKIVLVKRIDVIVMIWFFYAFFFFLPQTGERNVQHNINIKGFPSRQFDFCQYPKLHWNWSELRIGRNSQCIKSVFQFLQDARPSVRWVRRKQRVFKKKKKKVFSLWPRNPVVNEIPNLWFPNTSRHPGKSTF